MKCNCGCGMECLMSEYVSVLLRKDNVDASFNFANIEHLRRWVGGRKSRLITIEDVEFMLSSLEEQAKQSYLRCKRAKREVNKIKRISDKGKI